MRLLLSIWKPGGLMSMAQRAVDQYRDKTYEVKKILDDDDNRDTPHAMIFVISNASKS